MASSDSSSSFSVSEELTLIPRWSIVLAFVAFVGIQYLFFFVLHTHYHSPFPVHVYFGASWGALVAVYMLMIGYISEDAPRRNMGKWLWILLCIVLQGGIGPVLYFSCGNPFFPNAPAAVQRWIATSTIARNAPIACPPTAVFATRVFASRTCTALTAATI